MWHRGFKHSVIKFKIKRVQDKKSKLDALQNFLGDEKKNKKKKQALIRKYEIIDTDFHFYTANEKGTRAYFMKSPREQGDTNTYEFIYMFTLNDYFPIY